MEALDELLRLDLLRTTDVPRRFRFRHPLVRRAVYDATAAGWRLGAHERCAAALAARGAAAAARAHHVERSAREGDTEAVAVLREAGEEAVRLAPASAAHWFGGALRLLPQTAPAEERVELLLARARALTAAGRFADSHERAAGGARARPATVARARAQVARACAGVESLLGRHERGRTPASQAPWQSLSDQGSPEAVALMIELAPNGSGAARYDEMRELGRARRRRGAARSATAPLTAAALAALALADSIMGAAARAEAASCGGGGARRFALGRRARRPPRGRRVLAGVELYLDRYAEGEAHAERALDVARADRPG